MVVQRLGEVGWGLTELLVERGADVTVTDGDDAVVQSAVDNLGVEAGPPEDLYEGTDRGRQS